MNTQTSWQFSPDEFLWVWAAETGLDRTPFPVSIIESPGTAEEYAKLRAEIASRYPKHGDPDLTGPLRALAEPEVQIILWGRNPRSATRLRTLAAAVGDLGVILFQKPGPTAEFGRDIKLVVTRRAQLGRHIAATMPQTPAGAAGKLVGYTPRVRGEEPPSSWLRNDDGRRPVEERIRLLLRAPRAAEGYIRIEQHPGGQPAPPPHYLTWIDIREGTPAAGRYLIDVDDNDSVLTPAAPDVIAREVARRAGLESR
ncbi:ESX secretion-associated protein EspG [Nocardia terpenica]|uniref:ESX secretion-associated protein EspG n=1 Tax=Nocardia terpenica TaxID=455432 RepID=A0A6G9YZT7_9NOCA|nr:ESX secretion-associated protein EspG [Nocardia terpenica]QIS18758.1 ESX secretion-associated protein EspG [Nocardia terpenica]